MNKEEITIPKEKKKSDVMDYVTDAYAFIHNFLYIAGKKDNSWVKKYGNTYLDCARDSLKRAVELNKK